MMLHRGPGILLLDWNGNQEDGVVHDRSDRLTVIWDVVSDAAAALPEDADRGLVVSVAVSTALAAAADADRRADYVPGGLLPLSELRGWLRQILAVRGAVSGSPAEGRLTDVATALAACLARCSG